MQKESTAAPFIHPDSRFKTTPATIIALVVLIGSGVAAWTWARADIAAEQKTNAGQDVQLFTLDTRVRSLEAAQTDIAVMKNDVQWIRRSIERQQKEAR